MALIVLILKILKILNIMKILLKILNILPLRKVTKNCEKIAKCKTEKMPRSQHSSTRYCSVIHTPYYNPTAYLLF